jgi:hypothetical protein
MDLLLHERNRRSEKAFAGCPSATRGPAAVFDWLEEIDVAVVLVPVLALP